MEDIFWREVHPITHCSFVNEFGNGASKIACLNPRFCERSEIPALFGTLNFVASREFSKWTLVGETASWLFYLIGFTWMPMMITQILLIAWSVNLSKEDGLYICRCEEMKERQV